MAKILLIEDVKDTRHLYTLVLKKAGHDVTAVENGKKGLAALKKDNFDLLVLDIMMPRMDGLEVAKHVREFSQIPILIVSVKDDEVTVQQAKDLYEVVDYVVKPCTGDRLCQVVASALAK